MASRGMSMDFFEHQDVARRKTGLLVFYFVIAVILMVLALYGVALLAFSMMQGEAKTWLDVERFNSTGSPATWWFQPDVFLVVCGAMIVIIGLGTTYKTLELSGGGERLATLLGGRRINSNTRDHAERQLLNVVEEMAIAAGTAVPPVFLLPDEHSINAFAAGLTPGDAVIGVNRGTIEHLTRDELQGVIAHEFSHILNGDMRLNFRLIGILHGILVLSIIGYYTFRIVGFSGGSRGSSSKGKGGGSGLLPILLIGLSAWLIGYIGLFFGRLIKAAISRQREYLADASAVQFTRNPDGIAGALKKIGGLPARSKMETVEAETASHMFFGNALRSLAIGPWATHPPLTDRIRRIDPQFDGGFPSVERVVEAQPVRELEQKPATDPRRPGLGSLLGAGDRFRWNPMLVLAAVGTLNTQHMAYADQLLNAMPVTLREALHEPYSARAVVYALLLAENQTVCQRQIEAIRERDGEPVADETVQFDRMLKQQGVAVRLPVLEVVQATLQELTLPQYKTFRATIDDLVAADQKLSLLEFMLQRILIDHLDRHFMGQERQAVLYYSLSAIRTEAAQLMSLLAHAGQKDGDQARHAYYQAMAAMELSDSAPEMLERDQCTLSMLRTALSKLHHASPGINKRLLNAALVAVAADQQVTVTEAELLRAISAALSCPMPPLVAGPLKHPTADPESS